VVVERDLFILETNRSKRISLHLFGALVGTSAIFELWRENYDGYPLCCRPTNAKAPLEHNFRYPRIRELMVEAPKLQNGPSDVPLNVTDLANADATTLTPVCFGHHGATQSVPMLVGELESCRLRFLSRPTPSSAVWRVTRAPCTRLEKRNANFCSGPYNPHYSRTIPPWDP
jgi:hypothetical protein